MPNTKRYRELLANARKAAEVHDKAYNAARSDRGNSYGHQVTTKELAERVETLRLLYETLAPAEKRFFAGDLTAVDEIINFIEADIAVSRSGYLKERFYRRLKALNLDRDQVVRLQEIAIKRCQGVEQRREDAELRRLMIRLADREFLQRLLTLPDADSAHVQHKKSLMLEVILRGRKDLRQEAVSRGPRKS
jgi:hypothetical protein